jgi:hypothetical protein
MIHPLQYHNIVNLLFYEFREMVIVIAVNQ